jgi:LAO/AO transport system kinase
MISDLRTLARLATGVENRDPAALAELAARAPGNARIVGITGPPGAGKSTLVDALALALRKQGKTVAILAIDPSSRIHGGAILGDRIRMQQHHSDPGIFIRSMASRGNSGGIAAATADVARLMSAAGRDYVLIETVGVGQDEVAVARIAQLTIVVLVPGMGDDIQAIKSGILEIADLFVINKSDRPGAAKIENELRTEGHAVPILHTIATEGVGIEAIVEHLELIPRSVGLPADTGERSSPIQLDHIAIAVNSLADALPFYQSLGLNPGTPQRIPTEKVNVAMLPPLELLEPATDDSPISKFLATRGPGLHHIALRVPDLNASVEQLRAAGARLLNEPRPGANGHIYVFVHPASTGGVLLELIQDSSTQEHQ